LLYECPCLEFTRSFQLSEQVRAVQFPKEVRKKRLRTNTGARIARSLCLALQDSTSSDRRETRYPIAFDRWPERPSESFLQCRFLFHARPRGRADRDLQGSHAARN